MNPIDIAKSYLKKAGAGVLYERCVHRSEAREWIRQGRVGSPPHLIKQRMIRKFAGKYCCKVMIETGTYQGDMISAMRRTFREIHSIELSRELFEKASMRFVDLPQVHLHNGDSGAVLKKILADLHQPALFWLDAHYSEGCTARGDRCTPIEEELSHIFKHELADQHVLLIDDARTFNGKGDYPTLETVEALVKKAGYASFSVEDDVIRVCNPGSPA